MILTVGRALLLQSFFFYASVYVFRIRGKTCSLSYYQDSRTMKTATKKYSGNWTLTLFLGGLFTILLIPIISVAPGLSDIHSFVSARHIDCYIYLRIWSLGCFRQSISRLSGRTQICWDHVDAATVLSDDRVGRLFDVVGSVDGWGSSLYVPVGLFC